MKTIVFTGGGTAGHVTPNIALMAELDQEQWDIHYIGTREGKEKELIEAIPYVHYHTVSWGKLRRYFSLKNFTDPFRVIKGYFQAKKLLKGLKPTVVFSKGGYVAVPVVAAAKGLCPIICHESDFTPGLANKLSAPFADRICVTFEDTLQHLPQGKGVVTGTPLRGELFQGSRKKGLDFCGFTGDKPVLLVVGGSSGAEKVNEALWADLDTLLLHFDIVHLCGQGKGCRDIHKSGYVQFEYINREMADVLSAADVILSRAGANAVFEFLALHKPALLVPLPADNSRGDQVLNARYFEKQGFSAYLSQDQITPELLTDSLLKLYENRNSYIRTMEEYPASNGTQKVLELILKAAESEG